jgi:hypothetical protein
VLPAPSPNQHQARKVSSAESAFEASSSSMKEASLRQLLSDSNCTAQGFSLPYAHFNARALPWHR